MWFSSSTTNGKYNRLFTTTKHTIMTIPVAIERLLIFTDLDATLLDHDNYSFEAALPALNWLDDKNVPVIPTTSKTKAELAQIRKELNNAHPFIVENGAQISIPINYFLTQPKETTRSSCGKFWNRQWQNQSGLQSREHWHSVIETASKSLGLQIGSDLHTFHSLGTEGIIKATGLPEQSAKLANQRESSEPILLVESSTTDLQERKHALVNELRALGAGVVEGGRFIHVMPPNASKGTALQWLSDIYATTPRKTNQTLGEMTTIALGDSQNDVDMLETANYSILIRNPHKAFPTVAKASNLIKSDSCGPEGWNQSIRELLGIQD